MPDLQKGLLITLFGVLCVVPDSLFVRLILADPLVIAFWRGVIAGGIIMGWMLFRHGVSPFRAALSNRWLAALYLLAVGGAGVMFVLAVSLTSVANVVFIIASMPVFAAIYSRLFLQEPVGRRMILTMGAVFIGLGFLAFGTLDTRNTSVFGDVLALGIAALFAAGLTAARYVRPVSLVPLVPVAYLGASALLLPFIQPFTIEPSQWWLVVLHGLFISCSSIALAIGPRYLPSAEVALLILLESVLAPILAWAVLDEVPGRWGLVGGGVVLTALAVSNFIALRRGER